MAYMKYKEITKYFYFSEAIATEKLPKYVQDHRYDDETFLVGYHTARDYGVITSQRILLFDNWGPSKEITSVPYSKISSCSVVFRGSAGDLSFMLDSGYPMRIKFVRMKDTDKKRLRIIYSCIVRAMDNQKMNPEDVRILRENDLKF